MALHSIVFQSLYLFAVLYRKTSATCNGVLVINAVATEILDTRNAEYSEEVGRISYSVDLTGNLNLTSTTSTFTCGSITNFVSSNTTSPASSGKKDSSTNHNKSSNATNGGGDHDAVQSFGAQLHCSSQQEPVGTDLQTPWQTLVFYGSLFFQIEVEGDKCGKPAQLVSDYSRCSYNATTNTGRNESHIPCNWSTSLP